MRSFNMYYKDFNNLKEFIESNNISNSKSLLIQVFTGICEKDFIENLQDELNTLLGDAVVIGATTDGEIMNGDISTHATVISFTIFEDTRLTYGGIKHKQNGYFSGEYLAKNLIEKDTKLLIGFVDGLHSNGEAFLDGISSVDSSVIVSGGLAGDNATFTKTYVFTKDFISSKGAVCVAFSGEKLKVNNRYSFNWRRVGRELTLTKVDGNRVYTIDDRTAVETYMHYLGEEMAEGLPAIGIEFPLIMTRDGVKVARAVLAKHNDGSLSFAGNLKEGDKVQIGYGDPEEILNHSKAFVKSIYDYNPEVIFVYSCMARRHFMAENTYKEIAPLQKIAPVSGFFTYGEFFTGYRKELLNETMTTVILSEDDSIKGLKELNLPEITIPSATSMNALIHLTNVTAKEAMREESLRKEKDTFEILFNKSPNGLAIVDNHRFLKVNNQFIQIFGYENVDEFLKESIRKFIPKKQLNSNISLSKMISIENRVLSENIDIQVEWLLMKKNGKPFWADITFTSMFLDGKNMIYIICRDISHKKEMELELENQKKILYRQAYYDTLTDLPNRAFFMKELDNSLVNGSEDLVILFIDLDRFKQINDSLGHATGDKVLKLISDRLQRAIRKDDIVARLGGDEFLVLIRDVRSDNDILIIAQKILKYIEKRMYIDHYRLYVSASIGIAKTSADGYNAENLLKYADTAMYKAKEGSSNKFKFYTTDMTDVAYDDFIMERDLREAIKKSEFILYYQPQVDMSSGKISGVEALIRWIHPEKGLLFPDAFIPLAEKTGLIVDLDLWVMTQAMKDMSKWKEEKIFDGVLGLNMSVKLLEYTKFEKRLYENLKKYNFKHEWLELEVTESDVMQNSKEVIPILERIHKRGISISIDDFGTGYSSLSQLKKLPISRLKIDRSFITDLPDNKDDIAIVKTIVSFSKSLNLDIIAEGVEDISQRDFLLKEGCSFAQGYLYSKPIDEDSLKLLLKKDIIDVD